MTTSVLATATYWRDLAERAGRQATQAAIPIIATVGIGAPRAVAVAILIAILFTLLKALVPVIPVAGEHLGWQLLDRAVPAAAGTALGLLPVDLADITAVSWTQIGWASLAAAVLAILGYFVTPPSVTK